MNPAHTLLMQQRYSKTWVRQFRTLAFVKFFFYNAFNASKKPQFLIGKFSKETVIPRLRITLPTFANLLLLLSRDTLRYLSSLCKTPNICPESSFFYIKFYGKLKILRGFYQSFLRSITVTGEWTTTQSFFKGKEKSIVKCQPFSLEKLKGWQYKSLSQG